MNGTLDAFDTFTGEVSGDGDFTTTSGNLRIMTGSIDGVGAVSGTWVDNVPFGDTGTFSGAIVE